MPAYRIVTDRPVALDSPDHLHPFGTAVDNSVAPAFNAKLFTLIGPAVLDLGCAGGGFVESILKDGGEAFGVEGSDYSLVRKRAAWTTIPDRLFTADITKPFKIIRDDGAVMLFNVITAWEVLEHIQESDLAGLFDNIKAALIPDGYLIVSISTVPGFHDDGTVLHQNVQSREWWIDRLGSEGFTIDQAATDHFGRDWMRMDCWDNSLYAVFRRA